MSSISVVLPPLLHLAMRQALRIIDLCQWFWGQRRVKVAKQTLSRELRRMGYCKLSARPRHHAQAEGAVEALNKISRRVWTRSRARRESAAAT